MKCWCCGHEHNYSSPRCGYCGAPQERIDPTTEIGRRMRQIYDQQGILFVLNDPKWLLDALQAAPVYTVTVRRQILRAFEAGAANLYYRQIRGKMKKEPSFSADVKKLLSEKAGLSLQDSRQLMAYFDEMIGWQ